MEANRERMARHRSTGARAWRGTIEEAVSLLPTPAAGNFNDGEDLESWEARRQRNLAKGINGNGQGTPLTIAAQQLLKTPTAQLAVNGGSQHPDKRRAGGHGPTLADQVEHLLPTPRATDGTKGGPNQRGSSGDLMLPSAVMLLPTPRASDTGTPGRRASEGFRPPLSQVLLPTPTAMDSHGARNATANRSAVKQGTNNDGWTLSDVFWTGETTRPPSTGGKRSSAAEHPGQLSLDELDSG